MWIGLFAGERRIPVSVIRVGKIIGVERRQRRRQKMGFLISELSV